ncbi:hypothetical protein VTK56DRAFT_9059 [Thermocarpiscus australiensis]
MYGLIITCRSPTPRGGGPHRAPSAEARQWRGLVGLARPADITATPSNCIWNRRGPRVGATMKVLPRRPENLNVPSNLVCAVLECILDVCERDSGREELLVPAGNCYQQTENTKEDFPGPAGYFVPKGPASQISSPAFETPASEECFRMNE